MSAVHLDLETYSDLDLRVVGAHRYASHPGTDVLCVALGDEIEQVVWVPGQPRPPIIHGVEFHGYNVPGFDALIWYHILTPRYGWPWPGWESFHDTMARAAYTNLPGSLAAATAAMGGIPKDIEGHKLMMKLSRPARAIRASSDPRRHHTPEAISRLAEYCKQDVRAESDLSRRLPPLPARERTVFLVDQKVNHRGVHVNVPLVRDCIRCAEGIAQHYREQLATITHGAVESETALPTLKAWCREQGVDIREGKGGLDKAMVETLIDAPHVPRVVKDALRVRQILGKSSLAKLERMLQAMDPGDHRLRGVLAYYGAHQTGRWAGKIIQPQNFPRKKLDNYQLAMDIIRDGPEAMMFYYGGDSMDLMTAMLRPCLDATPGCELVIGDYNAIECRVVAWLAGEAKILEAFRSGKCPYKMMASVVFNVPYDAVTKDQRQLGKVIVLACGYGMGGSKFQATALIQYGMELTEGRAQELVNIYRATNTRIVRYWYEVDEMAKSAIRTPGREFAAGLLTFKFNGTDLGMRLPSGRALWYRRASIGEKLNTKTGRMMPAVFFYGEDDHGNFTLQNTYGGKLVENACQAISRDVTADALVRAENRGLCPVLTVHDELISDLPPGRISPREYEAMLCEAEPWCRTLPLKAEAFASPYYRK